ncbi:MAG: Dam family site-specific DNA-(adenine-N6)-methyltransferase [Ignavibacteriaceae bacterium]
MKLAKPFLKWAGGKTQLLTDIDNNLPPEIKSNGIKNYYEPFLGSAAVFLFLKQKYNIENAYLSDISSNLISTFKIVRSETNSLIKELKFLDSEFKLKNLGERKVYYNNKREEFNALLLSGNQKNKQKLVRKASLTIFLNKTCFNGLYRVNKSGQFNVPFGRYENPKIIDEENLLLVSQLLRNVVLEVRDFKSLPKIVKKNSFIYYDPPYSPLNKTSNFTSYSEFEFSLKEQEELAKVYVLLDKKGTKQLLSNADLKSHNSKNDFHDNLYYKFTIKRILASRVINSKSANRGKISELLVSNY